MDNFLDFLEKIWSQAGNLKIDNEELLLNIDKIFTEERINQVLLLMENIKNKAEEPKNDEIKKIFMPLDFALFEYKVNLENNNYQYLTKDEKIKIGGNLIRAMLSLTASRNYFSEK